MEIKCFSQALQEIFNVLHYYTDTAYRKVAINHIDAEGRKSLQENRSNALIFRQQDTSEQLTNAASDAQWWEVMPSVGLACHSSKQ